MGFKQESVFRKAEELERSIIDLENSLINTFGDCSVFFGQEDSIGEAESSMLEAEKAADQEEKIKKFAQNFHRDVRVLASFYMHQFFSDKTMHCGGKIPKTTLDKRISMVVNYDVSRGVLQAYNSLSYTSEVKSVREAGESSPDIKLVNETLNLLAQSGIPQQFAGGMLLLYLEFVEGIEIDS